MGIIVLAYSRTLTVQMDFQMFVNEPSSVVFSLIFMDIHVIDLPYVEARCSDPLRTKKGLVGSTKTSITSGLGYKPNGDQTSTTFGINWANFDRTEVIAMVSCRTGASRHQWHPLSLVTLGVMIFCKGYTWTTFRERKHHDSNSTAMLSHLSVWTLDKFESAKVPICILRLPSVTTVCL